MSDRQPINTQENGLSPEFLNIITVVFMYGVIFIFYIQQMRMLGPGNRGLDVWLNTFVEAVGISTFTYVFPSAIQNALQRKKKETTKPGIFLLIFDILYVLIYAVFPPRPWWLNAILCVCTIALVLWTSHLIHLASGISESEQAGDNKMNCGDANGQPEAATSVEVSVGSENNRIT